MKREFWTVALLAAMAAVYANAGSLYSWSSGEVLTASQLNSNFQHIHNNMVGGHGPRLTDSDVSTSAEISQSKIANHEVLPVAWVSFASCADNADGGSTDCTISDSFNVTSVVNSGSSNYTVTFPTLSDTAYGVVFTPYGVDGISGGAGCFPSNRAATNFILDCPETVAGTVVIFDND